MRKAKDNIASKRATYDISFLKYLLQDVTFVSYFNVFLNLPIFPRRVTYLSHKNMFNVEPVLMRKYLQTHQQKVYKWLCEERLPKFIRSHLYFHYKLCKAVCSDNPAIELFVILENVYPDIPSLKDICGFYRFHHYMLESSGGIIIKFWLAVEQFHSLYNEERAEVLEKLFDDYMFVESPQALSAEYRAAAHQQITDLCRGVRFVKTSSEYGHFLQQFKDKLLRCKKLFRPLQDMILENIRTYWSNKYYLHLLKCLDDKKDVSRGSLMDLLANSTTSTNDCDDGDDIKAYPINNMKLCTTDGLRRTSQLVFSQDLKIDIPSDEYVVSFGEVPESRMSKSIESLETRIKDECIKRRQSFTPLSEWNPSEFLLQNERSSSVSQISGRRSSSLAAAKTNRSTSLSHRRRSSSPSILSTDSVNSTMRQSLSRKGSNSITSSPVTHFNSFDLQKMKILGQIEAARRPSSRRPTDFLQHPIPRSVEWARQSIGRKRVDVIQKYLEVEIEVYKCPPSLLRDEIYQENYCDALKQVFNEASLKAVDVYNLLELAIASDAIGGEDFKNYLSQYYAPSMVYNYMFWVEIEKFSNIYSTSEESMSCARGYSMHIIGFFSEQENLTFNWSFKKQNMLTGLHNTKHLKRDLYSLLYKYTHPDGGRFMDWNDPFTDSLWFAIVNNYSVVEWLALAQRYAAKKLLNAWLSYIEEKDNEFLQNCTVLRHQKILPPILNHTSEDLIYETMNSPNCHVMWSAMQLAEAIEYPGQHEPVLSTTDTNISPDHRSVLADSALSSPYKSPSPSKLFNDYYRPPSRRLLTGINGLPNNSPTVTVNESNVEEEVPSQLPQKTQAPGRRGDALILDTTFAQLEYNLTNTKGIDLSTDRISTIPKHFLDLLRTRELLAKFRQFLLYNEDNHDASILFWQIVESLKNCRNPKQRQERMQFIAHKFFGPVSSMKSKLLIDKNCEVYKELCSIKKVTHTMLISAQTMVAKELESIYWLQFLEVLPSHIREKIMCMAAKNVLEKKEFGKEKNRKLWVNFTINVINFKDGIMDPEIYKHFKQFLKNYVRDIAQKCNKNTQKRQVVNNKLIDIEKIEADLDFFIEVEKYKEICESVQNSARMGNYDPKEEEMSLQKGRVLYSCYIDSSIPPRVQINITHDKVTEIRKLNESCLFERGMFHDAALSIFPILAHFWKRFCLQRYAPVKVKITDSENLLLNAKKPDYKEKSHDTKKVAKQFTPSPELKAPRRDTILHVPHLAQGIIHLLNRYSESDGLQQFVCQNNPNHAAQKALNRNKGLLSRAGRRSTESVATLASLNMNKETLSLAGAGTLLKDDRKMSMLGNFADRRASIMSPRRCSTVRKPSDFNPGVSNLILPGL